MSAQPARRPNHEPLGGRYKGGVMSKDNQNMILEGPIIYIRALCIGVCSTRGRMDLLIQNLKGNKEAILLHEKLQKTLLEWTKNNQLDKRLSRKERDLLYKPLGKLSQQDLVNISWREEALSTLLWAINKIPQIPPYDSESDHKSSIANLHIMGDLDHKINEIKTRSLDEIAKARDIAEGWHWRVRTQQIINEKQKVSLPAGITLEKIIEISATEHYKLGEIPTPINNDYPVFKKAFSDMNTEEYSLVKSITFERHYALNWICGYSDNWDTVPTDT